MDINNLLVDLEKSKTQFHAVKNAAEILENSGFARIDESKKWKIEVAENILLPVTILR